MSWMGFQQIQSCVNRLNKIQINNERYVIVQPVENILYDRALDYGRQDNKTYGIYLISTMYDVIDFDFLRNELQQNDHEALTAFNEWVDLALNED